VVGVADDRTGQAIAAFVVPASRPAGGAVRDAGSADEPQVWAPLAAELSATLRAHVADQIGPIAKPATVVVVPDLPKTRSGKIMRRLLGDICDGRVLGDTTSLQDSTVPDRIAAVRAEVRRAS